MKKNNTGYTLVEIMVVVASLGLIMTSMVGIILGSFKAQNRTKSTNKIMENGTWIISELRKNVFNSSKKNVICAEDGLSVEVKNLMDGGISVLSCNQNTNQIASESALGKVLLNNSEVSITDCTDFVVCDENEAGEVTSLTFNFGIGATTGGISVVQDFTTKITLRN